MAIVKPPFKAATVNPLKMSQPLGASYAFMGMNRCMPVMHGSQGCTSFGVVLLVRHFREAIPLQTTAMNEATTIMGGYDNVEKAILNLRARAKPELIAICSTGLTETKGDDVDAYLTLIRQSHPEVNDTALVYVSTPDYIGAFQDGWAKAVTALLDALVEPANEPEPGQVNVLPGCHFTPGDIDEVREIIEAFGLRPIFLPDVSGSMDGHMSDEFSPTTMGGTTLVEARSMGASVWTLALGEQMRSCAQALEISTGVPFTVFQRLTGLGANDQFLSELARISGVAVPAKYRRQRSQLQDAMLDGHHHTLALTRSHTHRRSAHRRSRRSGKARCGLRLDDHPFSRAAGRGTTAYAVSPGGSADVRSFGCGAAYDGGLSRHARFHIRDREYLPRASP